MDELIKAILTLSQCNQNELAVILDQLNAEGASAAVIEAVTQISMSAP